MVLDGEKKARYARHLLLPEIGERGQERLCAARVALRGDPRAVAAARVYLDRSGIGDGGDEVRVSSEEVRRIAGKSELEEAAAWVAGAFTAVETIKSVLGIGRPGSLAEVPSLDPGAPE